MESWKSYEASNAFDVARRKAFFRSRRAAPRFANPEEQPRLSRDQGHSRLDIEAVAMLDDGDTVRRLPALPKWTRPLWISAYKEYRLSRGGMDPFTIRVEEGKLVLEGGFKELLRLELLRDAGESTIEARLRAPDTCSILACSSRFTARACGTRVAG